MARAPRAAWRSQPQMAVHDAEANRRCYPLRSMSPALGHLPVGVQVSDANIKWVAEEVWVWSEEDCIEVWKVWLLREELPAIYHDPIRILSSVLNEMLLVFYFQFLIVSNKMSVVVK